MLFRLQSIVKGWLTHRVGRGEIIEPYRGL